MEFISTNDVTTAIDEFLASQLATKLEPELKKQNTLKENDVEKATKLKETIDKLHNKYNKSLWIADAANRMASQLKFGTHISKGVHPDAKGDNVNFQNAKNLPQGIVGSQLVQHPELDANDNAAALPLAAFFNIVVKDTKLRDLIQSQHPAIIGAFSDNSGTSNEYAEKFKTALDNIAEHATTHERNKQLLWPMDNAIKTDNYTCLVPLYPSSFTHNFYQKINNARYNEANKKAIDNRKKKNAEQSPYVTINELATTVLGGANPQNVSLLMSKQGGRNFLLPSLPPIFSQETPFSISKNEKSFFNNNLRYHCYFEFKELFAAIDHPKNIVEARDQRKSALDMILARMLSLAAFVQGNYPSGWSVDYSLNVAQKYWLDPLRGELKEQEDFLKARQSVDWINTIQEQFASWINAELRRQYPKKAQQFDDAEFVEWKREMEAAIKASQRAKQGVFE